MSPRFQERWRHWQHGLVQSLLGHQDYAATRIMLLAALGTISLPLYYLVWRFFLQQDYESLVLRGIGVALCLVGLFARRFSKRMLEIYLLVALSYIIPFFFTFMFLMNHASPVWTQSLLVGLITLFHFDMTIACLAYCIGTALACVGAILVGHGDALLSRPVLEQLPIHWFTIAVLSVVKVGRDVLEQEKLAGMGAGLATVAHELRTPLTSVDANVRGLNRILQKSAGHDDADRAHAHDALTRIQFEVRHMNHMIDLFLLSASAVSRKLHPNEAVSMAGAVDAVMKRYPFAGQAQQQAVVVEVRENFVFAGQSELCVVILLNLLRNALKAIHRAGKGRVRIIVDGGHATPRLLFIDTGCGIAARRMPLIFQRFYSYPAHNGSGIGLALCKQIVEAWNARIRCISRETAYAIFVLEFPSGAPRPAH
ncbi:HAMP domain-containing sensor histidine kinase [Janthinobacterium sp.]|uniref:sensor histidine kinase n=1 Tax=Janthinobacterium sp. TaxID=1871054 RepID=UPI00293D4B0E|nr:HAMP domain-containing sensor histidine kinase [Janthinobacterium sp.]